MQVKHSHTATGTNDASKQVSKDRWNADHTIAGPVVVGFVRLLVSGSVVMADHMAGITNVSRTAAGILQVTVPTAASSRHYLAVVTFDGIPDRTGLKCTPDTDNTWSTGTLSLYFEDATETADDPTDYLTIVVYRNEP